MLKEKHITSLSKARKGYNKGEKRTSFILDGAELARGQRSVVAQAGGGIAHAWQAALRRDGALHAPDLLAHLNREG